MSGCQQNPHATNTAQSSLQDQGPADFVSLPSRREQGTADHAAGFSLRPRFMTGVASGLNGCRFRACFKHMSGISGTRETGTACRRRMGFATGSRLQSCLDRNRSIEWTGILLKVCKLLSRFHGGFDGGCSAICSMSKGLQLASSQAWTALTWFRTTYSFTTDVRG